jgi:hypothetical protein
MRDVLKSNMRRARDGWFWPLVLLVLPNCSFTHGVGPGPRNLDPGPAPQTTLIFCDVERPLQRHCATDMDKAVGIRLAAAAVALNTGLTSPGGIGLDESPDALARCNGEPEAVVFQGAFPDGQPTCLNGTLVGDGETYADPQAVCLALCEDTFGATDAQGNFTPEFPPSPAVVSFCTAHSNASTNLPGNPNPGFAGGCTPDGGERTDFGTLFPDTRRNPEPVTWTDSIGTSAAGSSLTRTAAATGTFDAGATSAQWIARGDAFVEFAASEANLTHVLGLSPIPTGCVFPCPDGDPSLADIGFAISLNVDGRVYVIESGNLVTGPDINGSFGTYAAGDRFRVRLADHSDGTADVAYSRLVGPCNTGNVCPDVPFYTHISSPARYPLRADTSFREQGATLLNVTLVRIR